MTRVVGDGEVRGDACVVLMAAKTQGGVVALVGFKDRGLGFMFLGCVFLVLEFLPEIEYTQ